MKTYNNCFESFCLNSNPFSPPTKGEVWHPWRNRWRHIGYAGAQTMRVMWPKAVWALCLFSDIFAELGTTDGMHVDLSSIITVRKTLIHVIFVLNHIWLESKKMIGCPSLSTQLDDSFHIIPLGCHAKARLLVYHLGNIEAQAGGPPYWRPPVRQLRVHKPWHLKEIEAACLGGLQAGVCSRCQHDSWPL